MSRFAVSERVLLGRTVILRHCSDAATCLGDQLKKTVATIGLVTVRKICLGRRAATQAMRMAVAEFGRASRKLFFLEKTKPKIM